MSGGENILNNLLNNDIKMAFGVIGIIVLIYSPFISISDSFCSEYYDFNDINSQKFLPTDDTFGNWNSQDGMLSVGGVPNSIFGFSIKHRARISFDWRSNAGREGAGAFFFNNENLRCGGDHCNKVSNILDPGKIEWQVLGTGYAYIDNLSIIYENNSCGDNSSAIIERNEIADKTNSSEKFEIRMNGTEYRTQAQENENKSTSKVSEKPTYISDDDIDRDKYNSSYVLVDAIHPDENNYIYGNISNAIDGVDNGGTVILEINNYKEHVIINKPIKIVGKMRDDVILNNIKGESTILIKNDNITLENLTINGDYAAIELSRVNNCRIINNTISNSYDVGIVLDNSNEIFVSNNIIKDCKNAGISLEYSNNNTIDKNIIENSYSGIYLYFSEKNNFTINNRYNWLSCVFLCVESPINEYPNCLEKCRKSFDGKEHVGMFFRNNQTCPFEAS